MAPGKRRAADLTGIRQRGARFQVRIFGGIDPATGKQHILRGSAATEADAIAMRDGFCTQIANHTAVRTNVPLRVLLAEWFAGHRVEPSTLASYALLPALGDQTLPALAKLGPRPYERLYTELRVPTRSAGKPFVEHRTPRRHECDASVRAAHVPSPCCLVDPPVPRRALQCLPPAAERWGWVAFNPMKPRRSHGCPRTSETTPHPQLPNPSRSLTDFGSARLVHGLTSLGLAATRSCRSHRQQPGVLDRMKIGQPMKDWLGRPPGGMTPWQIKESKACTAPAA